VATTRRIRRIRGEAEPPLKLSELTPRERLEALNSRVRDLKPLLRDMRVQKLTDMRIINVDRSHEPNYGPGLGWDTRALPLHALSRGMHERPRRVAKAIALAVTTKGVWIYCDAEVHGSETTGFTSSSSFSTVPKREMLELLKGEPGAVIVKNVMLVLLQSADNVVRSHEQRAEDARRHFENARVLTQDVIDLRA
jgi:hypothetical protein